MPEIKQQEEPHFAAEIGHNEKGLVVDVFSYGSSEEGRAVSARISPPNGRTETIVVERIAPGHYQREYPALTEGDYRVEVTLPSGETLGPLGHTVPPRRTGEVPQPQSNIALLEAVARATGGTVNPDVATIVQPQSPPEQRPLLSSLISLAMLVYFVELLIRRGG
jgi:hypothetical protein